MREEAARAQLAADYLTLARLARDMIAANESAGNALELAWGHYFAGAAQFQRGDGVAAERAYRKAQELFQRIGNREGLGRAMLGLAAVALDIEANVELARQLYDQAVPMVRASGDKQRLAIALGNLGEICRMEGNYGRALEHAGEAAALFRSIGDAAHNGWALANMAHFHLLRREYTSAVGALHEAYRELMRAPNPRWLAWYFEVWFLLAAATAQWEPAARIFGFVAHYRHENSVPRMQGWMIWFAAPIELLHRKLSPERLHELQAEGESLTGEGAQQLVESLRIEP